MNSSRTHPEILWYYDFISPYAYLQHVLLKDIRQREPDFRITPVPVLFAGLLQHHGQKGPVEIPAKKTLTYRYCQWYADREGIPFALPAVHPFNPLALLRLAISRSNDPEVIDLLFRHVWEESADHPQFHTVEALERIPGFREAGVEISRPPVKQQLRHNTDTAISYGVFGVPTLQIGEQLFWGLDMTEMAREHWSEIRNRQI